MKATTWIGAAGASALLALGLVVAPPAGASEDGPGSEHPAGAARVTCASSDGKTQGWSMSDPDGTSNGGPDKPGCTTEIDGDRDGNNGCGNDADREDDNNGHCGLQRESGTDETNPSEEPSEATTSEKDSDVKDASEANDEADAAEADGTDKVDDDSKDDAEKDDDATSDDGTSVETPESPDAPKPGPIDEAGVSVGLLALLGGIVRLFLRIG